MRLSCRIRLVVACCQAPLCRAPAHTHARLPSFCCPVAHCPPPKGKVECIVAPWCSRGVRAGAVGAVLRRATNARVYIGNLSWAVDDEMLTTHMETAGTIVSATVMRKRDGRSKGCAIVEYSTPAEAEKAKTDLTDSELEGRKIFVREDKEPAGAFNATKPAADRAPRTRRTRAAPADAGAPAAAEGTSLYIGNLSWEATWQDLKDLFADFGCVYTTVKEGRDGRSRGWGIVRF
ncbi:unnamed protein product, partial [Symbiodinium sp. KB8]